jgi:hypothetical protein
MKSAVLEVTATYDYKPNTWTIRVETIDEGKRRSCELIGANPWTTFRDCVYDMMHVGWLK